MIDLLFPKTCYFCKTEGSYICHGCLKKYIKIDPINRCHICNKESRIGFVHSDCKEYTYLDGIINLTIYDGLVKKMIYDIKYNYYYEITSTFAEIMAEYLCFYNFTQLNSCLTYVPAAKKKLKIRGFNQSKLLSSKLSELAKIPVFEILEKTKETKSQANLHKQGRAENLREAFKVKPGVKLDLNCKNILIIDDVFTTGATLNECARVLKDSQSPDLKIFGFVIAKARG